MFITLSVSLTFPVIMVSHHWSHSFLLKIPEMTSSLLLDMTNTFTLYNGMSRVNILVRNFMERFVITIYCVLYKVDTHQSNLISINIVMNFFKIHGSMCIMQLWFSWEFYPRRWSMMILLHYIRSKLQKILLHFPESSQQFLLSCVG